MIMCSSGKNSSCQENGPIWPLIKNPLAAIPGKTGKCLLAPAARDLQEDRGRRARRDQDRCRACDHQTLHSQTPALCSDRLTRNIERTLVSVYSETQAPSLFGNRP
jgi:hypothetical protein